MADDFRSDYTTTGRLEPAHGVIGAAGDQDWFKVHLQAGGGTLDTADHSPAINLWMADGSNAGYSSPAVGEPRIFYHASASGDYFVDVHVNGGLTGSYTVNETLTSGDVSAPVLTSSSLQSGAVNTPLRQKIVLDYSEAIMLGSGGTLKDADGVDLAEAYHQSVLTVLGHTLTIDPHIFLKPGIPSRCPRAPCSTWPATRCRTWSACCSPTTRWRSTSTASAARCTGYTRPRSTARRPPAAPASGSTWQART